VVLKKNIFKDFSYRKTYEIWFPRSWPHPIPRGHDLNKFESALSVFIPERRIAGIPAID
jgi:hypothetical protein